MNLPLTDSLRTPRRVQHEIVRDQSQVAIVVVDNRAANAGEWGTAVLHDTDGTVGINDFLQLLANWGTPYGINDFLTLLANWGPCPS